MLCDWLVTVSSTKPKAWLHWYECNTNFRVCIYRWNSWSENVSQCLPASLGCTFLHLWVNVCKTEGEEGILYDGQANHSKSAVLCEESLTWYHYRDQSCYLCLHFNDSLNSDTSLKCLILVKATLVKWDWHSRLALINQSLSGVCVLSVTLLQVLKLSPHNGNGFN